MERFAALVQPFLAQGEQLQTVFPAFTGVNPNWETVGAVLSRGGKQAVLVAVTDKAIVVLNARRWRHFAPKSVRARLRRDMKLGAPGFQTHTGRGKNPALQSRYRPLWDRYPQLGLPEPTWVFGLYQSAVEAADALAPRGSTYNAPDPKQGSGSTGEGVWW